MKFLKRRLAIVIGVLILSAGVILSFQNCVGGNGGGSNVLFSCSKIQQQEIYKTSITSHQITQDQLALACAEPSPSINTKDYLMGVSAADNKLVTHLKLTCAARWCNANTLPAQEVVFGRVVSDLTYKDTTNVGLKSDATITVNCESNLLSTAPAQVCEALIANAPPVDRIIYKDKSALQPTDPNPIVNPPTAWECSPCGCGWQAVDPYSKTPSDVESCSKDFCQNYDKSAGYIYGVLMEVADDGTQTYYCSRAGGITGQ